MEITRETVNQWLESGPSNRDRKWLAAQCAVQVSAVGNWLNKKGDARPIPAEHQITIRRLMEEDAAAAQAKPQHHMVLEFDDPDYERIERAALVRQETVREWAKRTLNEIAEADVQNIAAELQSLEKPAKPKAV